MGAFLVLPEKPFIHPLAIVAESAHIGHGAWIGPNVIISDEVYVGPYSVIGGPPEHRAYFKDYVPMKQSRGVFIGKGVRISEFVTVHAGTLQPTKIDEDAAVFQHSHVAHDCLIQKGATIGGQVSLAGHTIVMKWAIVGGKACTHQFAVIGHMAFLAPMAFLKGNIPPAEVWIGCPARPSGINEIGLSRIGFEYEDFLAEHQSAFEERIKK